MDFGVTIFPTYDAIGPGDIARLAEERGQESLFFPEHTHRPADHSPHPSGRRLPARYARTLDLFVAITAAVTATSRLRVGSGVPGHPARPDHHGQGGRQRRLAVRRAVGDGPTGFDRVVHWLPSAGRGPVERDLDAWETAIVEFTGG
jgi:hypothetical protein